MFESLKIYTLKRFYRYLIVKIDLVDKVKIHRYDSHEPFCTMVLQSNKGPFEFIFREDRRAPGKLRRVEFIGLSSYFVELTHPPGVEDKEAIFKDKIAVVVKLRVNTVNYKALASLLLDLYIDHFTLRVPCKP